MTTETLPAPDTAAAPRGRPLLWAAFVLFVLAVPVTAWLLQQKRTGDAPPPLATLPGFSLTAQDGRVMTLEDFRGRIWVANFIFTSCQGACPLLTQKMAGVQKWIVEAEKESRSGRLPILLASFTVDPKVDTPERLTAYGDKYGADFGRWHFLTGPLPEIERTVVKGFRMSMDAGMSGIEDGRDAPSFEQAYDIMHGERFVLVDWQGRIRGYYVTDREGLGNLSRDIRSLLAEMGAG
ncbi:MAG: SCO family protein [Deltaproteobacteria bacterium]|nr:SCO family protein [Deltaproteobacteria bacterium]